MALNFFHKLTIVTLRDNDRRRDARDAHPPAPGRGTAIFMGHWSGYGSWARMHASLGVRVMHSSPTYNGLPLLYSYTRVDEVIWLKTNQVRSARIVWHFKVLSSFLRSLPV